MQLRLVFAAGVLVSLGACVTTRIDTVPIPSAETANHALQQLQHFNARGRIAFNRSGNGGSVSMSWQQSGSRSTLKLTAPFGLGGLQMQQDGERLVVESSRGERLEGQAARQALNALLGFDPPIEVLRYWLLGLPAPQIEAEEQRNAAGQLSSLRQSEWFVQYDRYVMAANGQGTLPVPAAFKANRDDISLRLVVDEWQLGAAAAR